MAARQALKCRERPAAPMTNPYQAFAEWRINTHRSTRGKSVRYFRLSRDHTVIWSVVMHGHYAKSPPAVKDCIAEARCSKETARRILQISVARGYFRFVDAPTDSRKKLVVPSRQCIAEYESMVDGYLSLPERLGVTTKARRKKAAKRDRHKI
jgi:hypothetical protein